MHAFLQKALLLQLCQDTINPQSCTASISCHANCCLPLHCEAAVGCRLVARLPDASRKAEEYAALGLFQEAAETAATVSPDSVGGYCVGLSFSDSANAYV